MRLRAASRSRFLQAGYDAAVLFMQRMAVFRRHAARLELAPFTARSHGGESTRHGDDRLVMRRLGNRLVQSTVPMLELFDSCSRAPALQALRQPVKIELRCARNRKRRQFRLEDQATFDHAGRAQRIGARQKSLLRRGLACRP